ncbi:MAG: SOS response-associated peptidase [Pyrinomonadaceae bacterium]|nr:SOS response-associated peptidase [Pyrinomonadaceae bacterium]
MCGRVTQAKIDAYRDKIYRWLYPDEFEPRHNLRPTEPAWIVARRTDGEIQTIEARWWCQRDGSGRFEAKYPTFNARVDTMHDKRTWSDLLNKGQRCVFPVDSFYEWPIKGKGLPPVEIFTKGRGPIALAGLWSRYFDNRQTRYSFAVFTTEPNAFMRPIHEKAMPVILGGIDEQKLWLTDGDEALLRPYEGEMEFTQLADTLERTYPEENHKY